MRKLSFIIISVIAVSALLLAAFSVSAASVDKSSLEALVIDARTYQKEQYETTTLRWNIFQNELQKAEKVLADEYASQRNVDDARSLLLTAIINLGTPIDRQNIDKSQLSALITEASAMVKTDYDVSNEEWQILQTELAAAQTVLDGKYSTQDEIDTSCENLRRYIDYVNQWKKERVESEQTASTETIFTPETESVRETRTEKPTETLPKLTTPFLEGGFIEIGCDASVAISALAIVGIIGAMVVIKKKED